MFPDFHDRLVYDTASFDKWGMPRRSLSKLCQVRHTRHRQHPDQGNQFTATEFTEVVLGVGCKLSMDGRGAWRDNVFVERLWRTIQYKHVYASVSEARTKIAQYIDWYNVDRAHSGLDDRTPDQAYWDNLPGLKVAA